MNIAKKLLFGLLLGGALLTAACGDDAKAKKGEECTKEKLCDDKLVCVPDQNAADKEKGKCEEVCDETKCTKAGGECTKATKLKDGDDPNAKYCKKTEGPVAKNPGDTCTDEEPCNNPALACVTLGTDANKTCQTKCTLDSSDADADVAACPTGKKKCKAASTSDTTTVCQAPAAPPAKHVGDSCTEQDPCNDTTLACVKLTAGGTSTCEKVCTETDESTDAATCNGVEGKPKCKAAADPAATRVCQAGS